jgi:predicted RNA-binding protein with TRAM domain
MEIIWLAGGTGVAVLLLLTLLLRRRGTADSRASKRAHDAAQKREPPVEIGGTYEFGITEFTDHHTGDRVAVGKVEGFVIFTEDVPKSCAKGDAIRATVTSFNRGHTSADATFSDRV